MNQQEAPINFKAASWTIGIHILLFLLFFMVRYNMPAVAAVEELGMEVNLGTSEDGSGTDQPMSVESPADAAVRTTAQANASNADAGKSIMESEDPDAPAISSVKENLSKTNTTPKTTTRNPSATNNNPQPTPNTQKPRYVYQGSQGNGGNNAASNAPGTSEGNTTGNGDRGVPGGTPGASNYKGSPGNGTGGVSHSLSGRDISPRQFEAEFNEGGKVVISVTVDREGKIVSKRVKSTPNANLSRIALQKLSQAKFSASKDAAPQQFGEITIVFKTRS